MKKFLYCQDTKRGMRATDGIRTEKDLMFLPGWMQLRCKDEDKALLEWMQSANIGDKYEHRLGIIICIRDTYNTSLLKWC